MNGSSPGAAAAALPVSRAGALVEAFTELSKARLSALVVLTTATGYWLAVRGPLDWGHFLATLLGTALAAFGASAFNQVWELRRDARMDRTRNRPLPSGQLTRGAALAFAFTCGAAGPLLLGLAVNPLTGLLALACELIYVLVYTPLKTRTALNTLVGAVCGAIPPMMGWTAVRGALDAPAWLLFAVLFVWQLPHFFALAWLYRADYARGGFRMLPAADPSGRLTQYAVLLTAALLMPVTLALAWVGATGRLYFFGAAMLGGALLGVCVVFFRRLSTTNARGVFAATILYLAMLLLVMTVDRGVASPGL